jgi:hypothetical protein
MAIAAMNRPNFGAILTFWRLHLKAVGAGGLPRDRSATLLAAALTPIGGKAWLDRDVGGPGFIMNEVLSDYRRRKIDPVGRWLRNRCS